MSQQRFVFLMNQNINFIIRYQIIIKYFQCIDINQIKMVVIMLMIILVIRLHIQFMLYLMIILDVEMLLLFNSIYFIRMLLMLIKYLLIVQINLILICCLY